MSPPPNVENIAANNDSAFFTTHMAALLHKRAAYFRRDTKTWCFTFGLPAIFVLAGLFLIRVRHTMPQACLSLAHSELRICSSRVRQQLFA